MSAIITTHNRPRHLREAVESVLRQTFTDLELIVVDDASGAETGAAIRSFRDARVRHLRNQARMGSTKSLNLGLDAARGEYVAILDDDDSWVDPRKLERQVKFLDSRPDYVCVGAKVIVVAGEDEREIARSAVSGEDERVRPLLLRMNPFAHSSVLYRREAALAAGGYDESLPRGKDYDLCLKLAESGKVAVLDEYFVKYREATSRERNLVAQRYEDAKWTLEVVRRHRRNFPGGTLSYLTQLMRYGIFSFLVKAPFLYALFRATRKR